MGYGDRVGNTGWVIPGPRTEPTQVLTAKRAPDCPAGAGSGWSGPCGVGGSQNPPFGPGRSMLALPGSGTLECRLWANRARFDDILLKVSQNGEVSAVYVEKACHSPCFQNEPQKSPLEIPRFPFCAAFSHKELMGHFRPWTGLNCQNDEVSPDVHTRGHPDVTRSGRQIPPDVPQQAASGTSSSSDSARYSQLTRLFLKTRHILRSIWV